VLPASAAINWTEITDILDGVGTSLFPSLITLVTAAVPIIIIVTVVAFVTGFLDKILGMLKI
jgi:ABC-type multidrug transport system permease subunit